MKLEWLEREEITATGKLGELLELLNGTYAQGEKYGYFIEPIKDNVDGQHRTEG